jgi:hypothetical protein
MLFTNGAKGTMSELMWSWILREWANENARQREKSIGALTRFLHSHPHPAGPVHQRLKLTHVFLRRSEDCAVE